MSLDLRCPECGASAERMRNDDVGDSLVCINDSCPRIIVAAIAPSSHITVVIDTESDDGPHLLGTYEAVDGQAVVYSDTDGRIKSAPYDCVRVLKVTL